MPDQRIRVPYGLIENGKYVYKGSFLVSPELFELLDGPGIWWAEWPEFSRRYIEPTSLDQPELMPKQYHARTTRAYFHGGQKWSALLFADAAQLKSFKRYLGKQTKPRKQRRRPKRFSYIA